MIQNFTSFFGSDTFSGILIILWKFLPLWLPIILFVSFAQIYIRYIRTKWISEQSSILLELKLPKEILKSPVAMEIVLSSLAQPFVGNYLDVYLKGRVRAWFSLELVSIEGQVRFFIWAHKGYKNTLESQIYAQFPTVEIYEVPDYATPFHYDPTKFNMFGTQFKLTKDDAFPIKTYIDYGMDKDPKEEFKIDPMTPVLEFLGSLKKGEQSWIQILIQAHRKEGLLDTRIIKKPDWKSGAKKTIEGVVKESVFQPEEGKSPSFLNLSELQKETINSIQRNIEKQAFNTMIRCLYIAEKDIFNPMNIGGMIGSFKQYSSGNLNGFAPGFVTNFVYPWQDFRGTRRLLRQKSIIDAYKRRSYFHQPHKNFGNKSFILTTEELATIFHFPGGVAATPTFSRVVSKKGEAPANLPI